MTGKGRIAGAQLERRPELDSGPFIGGCEDQYPHPLSGKDPEASSG